MEKLIEEASRIVGLCPLGQPESVKEIEAFISLLQEERSPRGFFLSVDSQSPKEIRRACILCTHASQTANGTFVNAEKVGRCHGYLNNIVFRKAILFFEEYDKFQELLDGSKDVQRQAMVNQSALLVLGNNDLVLQSGPAKEVFLKTTTVQT
jgi:hypothetical protein